MKRRLESVLAKQIDVVREIVPRQDDLLEKIEIGSAIRPIDL
jgi:hypothetical protein